MTPFMANVPIFLDQITWLVIPTKPIFRIFNMLKNNRVLSENVQTCGTWQIASQYDAVMRLAVQHDASSPWQQYNI